MKIFKKPSKKELTTPEENQLTSIREEKITSLKEIAEQNNENTISEEAVKTSARKRTPFEEQFDF